MIFDNAYVLVSSVAIVRRGTVCIGDTVMFKERVYECIRADTRAHACMYVSLCVRACVHDLFLYTDFHTYATDMRIYISPCLRVHAQLCMLSCAP